MISPDNLLLIYGGGGVGKTNLIRRLAEYMWKKHQLTTRVVGADGGGTKPFKALMDKGILSYWPVDQRVKEGIFTSLDKASQGWWPLSVEDPTSPLEPSFKIIKVCPSCGKDTGSVGLAMVKTCGECKKAIPQGTRLEVKPVYLNGFDKVGVVAFEGATAFGGLLMDRLREINPEGGHCLEDQDGYKIAQSGQSHYGNAQAYLKKFIANARTIPTKVVAWTALELRGKDDYDKPVFGPAFPGKALTSACLPWFSDVLHLDLVAEKDPKTGRPAKDEDGFEKVERKLFLSKHFPEDAKPHGFEAKSSAPDGCGMPKVLPVPEGGNAMECYFEELEKAYRKAEEF